MKLLACLTALMLLASPVAAADFDKSYVPPALSGTASSTVVSLESPEGVVYCGGKGITRMIEYTTPTKPSQQNQWNVRVTIVETNVRTKTRTERQTRAMTAYSYFGKQQPPAHFKFALLLEDRVEMFVFQHGNKRWLEYGDYRYDQCN